jgi:hypothetical protein
MREPLSVKEPKAVYGLKPFARRGGIVTNELIDKLRAEMTPLLMNAGRLSSPPMR